MASIIDDRGYNQGFELVKSTEVRLRRRADMMIAEMSDVANKSILEIGCGTGEMAFWIAEKTSAKVLGADLCVPFIEDASKKYQLPNLRYKAVDFNVAEQINGEKFDYIIGNGILHHLYYNIDNACKNMFDLLNKNGKIIFIEPNMYNPYVYLIFSFAWFRKMTNLEPDEMAFSKKFIVKKLQQAGYQDIHTDCRDFLLPGIPSVMIKPAIVINDILEKIPVVRNVSQSIFITATKK